MSIIWRAHYTDGTDLWQDGKHGYHDIDRDNLVAFDLWQGNRLLVRVDMSSGDVRNGVGPKRLIWRKRHTTDGSTDQIMHMAGWQRKVNGTNVQSICYVFEDGAVLLGGQWNENEFSYPIAVLECERDLEE